MADKRISIEHGVILLSYFIIFFSAITRAAECTETQFKCEDGECIEKMKQCNVEANCKDKSDEKGCDFCEKPVKLYAYCIREKSQQVILLGRSIFSNNYIVPKKKDWPKRDDTFFKPLCEKEAEILKCMTDQKAECNGMAINSLDFLKVYLTHVCKMKQEYMDFYACVSATSPEVNIKEKRKKHFEDCTKKSLEEKKLPVPSKRDCSQLESLKVIIKCAAQTMHTFDKQCGTEEEIEKKLTNLDFGIPVMNCPVKEDKKKEEDKKNEEDKKKEPTPKPDLNTGSRLSLKITLVTMASVPVAIFLIN